MIRKLCKIIEKDDLFHSKHKLLLAISGGVDSMVMCDLLRKNGNIITVLHFNHQKRKEESDDEARLVSEYCRVYSIPFIYQMIFPEELKIDGNTNFHDLARKERYRLLELKRTELNYDFILTAHHEDDSIESFFMHILRGAGWQGMRGIDIKNGHIIRPLLHFSKNDLLRYATKNNIPYLEDSSNLSSKYRRNFVRQKLLPIIKSFRPGTKKALRKTIENTRESHLLLRYFLKDYEKKISTYNGTQIIIDKASLQEVPGQSVILFYILSKYGFNRSQAVQLSEQLRFSGQLFYSETHLLSNERKFILIDVLNEETFDEMIIDSPGNYMLNKQYTFTIHPVKSSINTTHPDTEYIDAQRLSFPLTLRKRKNGDHFQPLGMHGKTQKVKDFLTNQKVSSSFKKSLYILESKDQIVWVVGLRIDERFKILNSTTEFLELKISKR